MASNFKIQNMPSLSVQVSQFSLKPMFSAFNFITRPTNIPQFRDSIPFNRLNCLSQSSSSSLPSPISVSENSSIQHSFEVSYLINTFGWPPEVAISKAKYLKFKTPEKPERMEAFLKKYGFTKTQISHIFKVCPKFLVYNPEETFLPKFYFLCSLGLSRTEVTGIVAKEPHILKRSLEKILVPCFNIILDLLKSDDEAVRMIKRYPVVLTHKPEVDNVQILLEEGVPGANIVASMINQRDYTVTPPDNFRKMVEKVKEMGFDPCRMNFVYAIQTMRLLNKSNWEDKVQVLKKYGLSDRDILLAFEKCPRYLMTSKDKIEGIMDFLVNTMGVEATDVVNFPTIMNRSLEKIIVPRCLVYQSVLEKGLCKKKVSIITLCKFPEDQFLTRFIKAYENEAPGLWDIYKTALLPKPETFSDQ